MQSSQADHSNQDIKHQPVSVLCAAAGRPLRWTLMSLRMCPRRWPHGAWTMWCSPAWTGTTCQMEAQHTYHKQSRYRLQLGLLVCCVLSGTVVVVCLISLAQRPSLITCHTAHRLLPAASNVLCRHAAAAQGQDGGAIVGRGAGAGFSGRALVTTHHTSSLGRECCVDTPDDLLVSPPHAASACRGTSSV